MPSGTSKLFNKLPVLETSTYVALDAACGSGSPGEFLTHTRAPGPRLTSLTWAGSLGFGVLKSSVGILQVQGGLGREGSASQVGTAVGRTGWGRAPIPGRILQPRVEPRGE